MGYGELERRLRADFKRELDSIRAANEAEVNRIRADVKAEAESNAAAVRSSGERKAALEYRRRVGRARMEVAGNLSAEKNRLLEDVLDKAREEVLALPEKKKAEYLRRLAGDRALIQGKAVIRVDGKYAKLLKQEGDVKVIKDKLGDFGLIIESEDGSVRLDNRLNTLFAQAKVRSKPGLNQILFG